MYAHDWFQIRLFKARLFYFGINISFWDKDSYKRKKNALLGRFLVVVLVCGLVCQLKDKVFGFVYHF